MDVATGPNFNSLRSEERAGVNIKEIIVGILEECFQ